LRSAFGIAQQRYASRRRAPLASPAPDGHRPDEPAPGAREYFAPIELSPKVLAFLEPIKYGGPSDLKGRVFRVRPWKSWPMARRIAFMRAFVEDTSRDPAIARKTTEILKTAGVDPKDHKAAWAALLKWVQKNVYYVNERDERLQSPQYTLTEKHGDCDDCAIVLAALGDSIRLPWAYTISGKDAKGALVTWTEGRGPFPAGVEWTHIYL
jgi:transglutaminase-like putative cysteine protease